MTLQEELDRDLRKKLREDLAKAISHYNQMSEIAELDSRLVYCNVVEVVLQMSAGLALHIDMPLDILLKAVTETYLHQEPKFREFQRKQKGQLQ